MQFFLTKKFLAGVIVVLAIAALMVGVLHKTVPAPIQKPVTVATSTMQSAVIGASVEGRPITAYTYGTGKTHLLFVGGMHGGYEWNSVLLAYQFMDYLTAHPGTVSSSLQVTVIPSINPDGLFAVTGKEGRFTQADVATDTKTLERARFNAHNVDLNRNFDCKWQPQSTWKNHVVSAGTAAFSEPEAQALRSFVSSHALAGVVFWHSQANAVYASQCKEGILPGTLDLMNTYAKAAGYPAVKSFDAYPITGDSEGWLASIHIPAVTVELSTHESTEWNKNLAGINALLAFYSQHGI